MLLILAQCRNLFDLKAPTLILVRSQSCNLFDPKVNSCLTRPPTKLDKNATPDDVGSGRTTGSISPALRALSSADRAQSREIQMPGHPQLHQYHLRVL